MAKRLTAKPLRFLGKRKSSPPESDFSSSESPKRKPPTARYEGESSGRVGESSRREGKSSLRKSLEKSKRAKWPADTDKDECSRRNSTLTNYIKRHDWFMSHEFHLLRTMIMTPSSIPGWTPFRKKYPLIFDYEWECDVGRGDLVCTDGENNFLIVELKSLITFGDGSGKTHRTKKRQKLRQGEEQTSKFAQFWHSKNPQVLRTVGVFVTEEETVQLEDLDRSDTSSEGSEASSEVSDTSSDVSDTSSIKRVYL